MKRDILTANKPSLNAGMYFIPTDQVIVEAFDSHIEWMRLHVEVREKSCAKLSQCCRIRMTTSGGPESSTFVVMVEILESKGCNYYRNHNEIEILTENAIWYIYESEDN